MKKILITLSVLLIFVFGIALVINNNDVNTTILTSSADTLSNTKIDWGIKRSDNHEQPDVGSKNKEILDRYQGIYLGNKDKKTIYLTFDLGYEAGYTPKILEILKQNDVKATFFITAHYLNTQPDLVKQMIDEGHIIGNHTVNHKSMPSCSFETIKKEVCDIAECNAIRTKNQINDEPVNSPSSVPFPTIEDSNAPIQEKAPVKRNPVNLEEIYANAEPFLRWQEVVENLKEYSRPIAASFDNTDAYVSGDYLLIDAKTDIPFSLLKRSPEQKDKIRDAVQEMTGKRYKLGPYKPPVKKQEKTDPLVTFAQKLRDSGVDVTEE